VAALTLAVILLGTLCVLQLLWTFGVIRRLRTRTGSGARRGADAPGALMAPVGTRVRGTAVDWHGEILVGFFLPGCDPGQLPEFMALARTRPRTVAVLRDRSGTGAELAKRLAQVAEVRIEDSPDGALQRAFRVEAFPSYCLVRHGVISSVAARATDLALQAARIPA
jgi:hypothetical protein